MIWLTSDNAGPAAPEVMAAVAACNTGYTGGYGAEEAMARVTEKVRTLFDAPDAAVYLVATGTSGNALALATLVDPWSSIYCQSHAHIEEDECGAPEFFSGGAKLTLVPGADAKMDLADLKTALARGTSQDVHQVQRGAVSLTNVTELGAVYSVEDVAAIAAAAKAYDMPVHMDGARFANAVVASNASPADLTWRAGVDVLVFGGTKNGCLGVEAVIFFNPEKAWEFELRRKRAGHLWSKHRYLSAQFEAYLEGDLWRRLASQANAMSARLYAGLTARGRTVLHGGAANMIFASWSRAEHTRMMEAGARYYLWPHTATAEGDPKEEVACRLVCNWSTTDAEVDGFLDLLDK